MQQCITCNATLPESYVAEKRDLKNVFCDHLCQKKAYSGGILSLGAGPALYTGEWESTVTGEEKEVDIYLHLKAPVVIGSARLIIQRIPFNYYTVPVDIYNVLLPLFLHDGIPPEARFLPVVKLVATLNPRRLPWANLKLQFTTEGHASERDTERLLEFMNATGSLLQWRDTQKLDRLINQIVETGAVTDGKSENRAAQIYLSLLHDQSGLLWGVYVASVRSMKGIRATVVSYHDHLLFSLGDFFEKNATRHTFAVTSRPNGQCRNAFILRVPPTEHDRGNKEWSKIVQRYIKRNKTKDTSYQVVSFPPALDHITEEGSLSLVAFDEGDQMHGYITCSLHYIGDESRFTSPDLLHALSSHTALANASHFCRALAQEVATRGERFRPFQVLYIEGIHVDMESRGPENRLAQLLIFYMLRYAQAATPTVGVTLVMASAAASKTVSLLAQFGFDHWNVGNVFTWRFEDVASTPGQYETRYERLATVKRERDTVVEIAGRVSLEELERAAAALDRYIKGNRDESAGNVYVRYTIEITAAIAAIRLVLQETRLITRQDLDVLWRAVDSLTKVEMDELDANRNAYRGTLAGAIQAWRAVVVKYGSYFDQAPINKILDTLTHTDSMPPGAEKIREMERNVIVFERWSEISMPVQAADGFGDLMTSMTSDAVDCFLDITRTDNPTFTRQMDAIAKRIVECNNAGQEYEQAPTGTQKKKRENVEEGETKRTKKSGTSTMAIHLPRELLSDAW